MLVIRLQRQGRKKLAHYRLVVQDSHTHPTSGKVVEYVGHYDPHSKETVIEKERVAHFLSNGAQPSNRVALLLQANGVALPEWVNIETASKEVKNKEKAEAREAKKNAPAEEPAEAESSETTEEKVEEAPAEETTTEKEEASEEPAESKEEPEAVEEKSDESEEPSKEDK